MAIDWTAVTEWRPRLRAAGMVELAVCQRLRALAAAVPADQAVVELGAYRGRATGWLLLGAQDGHGAHVTTVDPWMLQKSRTDYQLADRYADPAIHEGFKSHMARIGATKDAHTVKRGYAASCGQKWTGPYVGLLWHDAEHTADAVERDLAAWLPSMADDSVIVLHDAGRPDGEVIEGARRVLAEHEEWDWAGRELVRWAKHPDRRGALIVRRVADVRDGGGAVLPESGDDPHRGDVDPGPDAPGPDVPGGQ